MFDVVNSGPGVDLVYHALGDVHGRRGGGLPPLPVFVPEPFFIENLGWF
jgi:hypothetical protein